MNLYDGPEQIAQFEEMFSLAGVEKERWKMRPHWPGGYQDFGLTLNNRSGNVVSADIDLMPLDEPLSKPCFYPFYKLLIDWNGDVLFCSNDWGREIVVGNVMAQSVREIWLSEKMKEVRLKLAKGDRSNRPCNKCNVRGTLNGESSFQLLMQQYEQQDAQPAAKAPAALAK